MRQDLDQPVHGYRKLRVDQPHLEKNVTHLLSHLEQRMERASVGIDAFSFKVVLFELRTFPSATERDVIKEVSGEKKR
jgi:hypothetical protein